MVDAIETIGNNVTAIAAESAKILENGRQIITKEVFNGTSLLTNDDYITIGKKLHENVGKYFNYENYICNASSSSVLPNGADVLLPIVYLNGDISTLSKENKVEMTYKIGRIGSKYFEGTCQVKYQGNTTWNTPKHNYAISGMSEKVDLGWGKQKKYVLKGEYREGSYVRNIVAAKLWGDIVRSRSDSNELLTKIKATPNCCAVDGYPCMLVLNGNYRGVFTLNIPKDKWMAAMGDGDREAILQCDSGNVDIQRFKAPLTKQVLTTEDLSIGIEHVPDENDVDWVVDSWNNIYTLINENQNNASFVNVLSPYVDIINAVDYLIFSCLIANWDGTSHNFLYMTYDGVKWFFTPYDLNYVFSFNIAYTRDPRVDKPTPLSYANENNLMKLIYTYTKFLIKSRYDIIRKGPMSEENVYVKFVNSLARIPERCRQVEYQLYPGEASTAIEQLAQITNWYRLRCQYMDAEIAAL